MDALAFDETFEIESARDREENRFRKGSFYCSWHDYRERPRIAFSRRPTLFFVYSALMIFLSYLYFFVVRGGLVSLNEKILLGIFAIILLLWTVLFFKEPGFAY